MHLLVHSQENIRQNMIAKELTHGNESHDRFAISFKAFREFCKFLTKAKIWLHILGKDWH